MTLQVKDAAIKKRSDPDMESSNTYSHRGVSPAR
jgi:hypothetical protein